MHELVAQPVKLGDFRSHFKKDIIVYIFDIHRDLFKSKIRNRQAHIILLAINLTDPPKESRSGYFDECLGLCRQFSDFKNIATF